MSNFYRWQRIMQTSDHASIRCIALADNSFSVKCKMLAIVWAPKVFVQHYLTRCLLLDGPNCTLRTIYEICTGSSGDILAALYNCCASIWNMLSSEMHRDCLWGRWVFLKYDKWKKQMVNLCWKPPMIFCHSFNWGFLVILIVSLECMPISSISFSLMHMHHSL